MKNRMEKEKVTDSSFPSLPSGAAHVSRGMLLFCGKSPQFIPVTTVQARSHALKQIGLRTTEPSA